MPDDEAPDLQCAICHCVPEDAPPVRFAPCTRCDRSYCRGCLERWLTDYNASCPTCRTSVKVMMIGDVETVVCV
jgi:hypothetical protein